MRLFFALSIFLLTFCLSACTPGNRSFVHQVGSVIGERDQAFGACRQASYRATKQAFQTRLKTLNEDISHRRVGIMVRDKYIRNCLAQKNYSIVRKRACRVRVPGMYLLTSEKEMTELKRSWGYYDKQQPEDQIQCAVHDLPETCFRITRDGPHFCYIKS